MDEFVRQHSANCSHHENAASFGQATIHACRISDLHIFALFLSQGLASCFTISETISNTPYVCLPLCSTGLFQNVDANVQPTGKGYVVEFSFREKVWPGMVEFKVSGATVLPDDIEEQVLKEARKSKYTTVRVLAAAKNIIEGYYQVRAGPDWWS